MKLDPREQRFRIPSPVAGLDLFLRHLPPTRQDGPARLVLYVHGGTFPSALSIAHRFDGRSWRDELCDCGFDVWGLDFLGFGCADRYPEMAEPAESHAVLGAAEISSRQIECAVRWICAHHNVPRLSIIAHSWGSIATGRFAGACPDMVDRLVLFGPVAWRAPQADAQRYPAWRLVSVQDQWARFTAEVPKGQRPGPGAAPFQRMETTVSRHRSRQPNPHAAKREDTERTVAGHRQRLGRTARL